MRYFNNHKCSFGWALLMGMMTLAASSTALANGARIRKYCLKWQIAYSDAGRGDDHMNMSQRDVMRVPVRIENYIWLDFQWPGGGLRAHKHSTMHKMTDYLGCFTVPVSPVGGYLDFTVYMSTTDDGSDVREFKVLAEDSHHWGPTAKVLTWEVRRVIFAFEDDPRYSRTSDLNINATASPQDFPYGLLPIGEHALLHAHQLGWKPGYKIAVAPMNNRRLCDSSTPFAGYFIPKDRKYSTRNICLQSEFANRKYLLGHEMGHAFAHMNSGPKLHDYGYTANEHGRLMPLGLADPVGACSHWSSAALASHKNGHIMNSREFIEAAAGEGFAHLVAAAMFNYRLSSSPYFASQAGYLNDAWFNYGKPIFTSGYFIPGPGTQRTLFGGFSLLPDAAGNFLQWTDRYCRPPTTFRHLGSEIDWLHFFWGLYSARVNGFTISEISNLWRMSRFPYGGSKQEETAYCTKRDPFGPGKRTASGEWEIEPGWECRPHRWTEYNYAKEVFSHFLGSPIPKFAKKYRHGVTWNRLLETVENTYGDNNILKYELFSRTGEQAGVVYP